MKQLQCLLLFSLISFAFIGCSDDIDDSLKIEGQWKLESISGGIGGGGFIIFGEITMAVDDNKLNLFNDAELIMDAKLSYEKDKNQLFININRSYKTTVPSFILGSSDRMRVSKLDSNSTLTLSDEGYDGYNYHFIMVK
ncbi:MAG: hypothetical protein ACJA1A_000812 [Saprospiraceae bacterium]|jgi:hypothetical protein|tara:strand:+ start:1858 stop:2274 length:417 start_codon:yes stop_codon:yes gene_type:complete